MGYRWFYSITTSFVGVAEAMLKSMKRPPFIGGVGLLVCTLKPQSNVTNRSEIMKTSNTTRATLIGATAAALLAATAGLAVADNAAPTTSDTTTTAPNQQQTGVTAPGQVLTQSTSEQSTATKTEPTENAPSRIWTNRAERGTNTHSRGTSD
jgi:hypothetical protein